MAAAVAGVVALPAIAQTRAQPIRFIVPYPPGGAADQITRLVAQQASVTLGTPIVVDNKGGVGGIIAAETVARAEPDGKTILVGSNAPLVINSALYTTLPYDPVKDFKPVAGMGKSPLLLVTRQDLQVKSLRDLVALGKQSPGKLTMGSASSGNITHLAGEYAASQLGFQVTHVPFAGSAPAIISLIGKNIDLMFDALPSSMQQAKSGKLHALAILDRFPLLPDVPTMQELGYPGLEASAWFGVVAPARTPDAAIAGLNRAINDVLKQADLQDKLHAIGAQPMPGSAEAFGQFVGDERARWIPLAKTLGVKAD
ncbi:tripartite tricarboxylate transporter substrate binding protein [Cupriavidus sp. WKF15]|uniref:Bug family tripartite tricarboxylate transporter substrate binding protein n=1 Tax=Cupriavidus sp. WKF15 TaxID=3032282 RepID=UPI0023E1B635|nr:tripartite tricarboxylate transporter substrate binding protein [Cupriavidus sp. WKF15]WER47677.1 tripartite tricarboxylate transporter substrate binding protein [Cupriavidus sp. WKF15]